ncbi:helix-turn-helix transcriptional regulator [Polaromonas hydrogenivorans]|uniref:LuxR C-terminal-related transcriptional regulator n=1 Tax=Polaromonas hydrogenivorans TaxID=335476 RepID=A0AAU7LYR9_9BURK
MKSVPMFDAGQASFRESDPPYARKKPVFDDIDELFRQQRTLRDRLLGHRQLTSGRELAAEMLLYLDDPQACWEVLTKWLLTRTRAQRVDVGFGTSSEANYRPKFERVRDGCGMRSVIGLAMDTQDSAISIVWASERAVKFSDIERDGRLCPHTRASLLVAGTRSKVAVALRDGPREVGLLCCDATLEAGAWTDSECWMIDTVAREVVGPVFAGLHRLHLINLDENDFSVPALECLGASALTPAEQRVSQLVVAGLSYKEIARQLARSPSTIDHQLRSIRRKLGVSSTAKLIHELMSVARDTAVPRQLVEPSLTPRMPLTVNQSAGASRFTT